MAIPANPTITTLCTAALKQGGIPSPTTEQISELAGDGMQTVKTEIWLKCKTDHILETRFYIGMEAGEGYLTTPADLDHELYLDVYSGPEQYAGTAQSGDAVSGTITLAADLDVEESALQGLFIFLTGGTGVGQHRQITGWDNDTKVLTPNAGFNVTPSSTTTYLIATRVRRLDRKDTISNALGLWTGNIGYPKYYTKTAVAPPIGNNPAYRVFPVPDHDRYACIMTYTPNLTLLDESSTLFIKHLRERRALWIQGLKVQVMQRYDDDRYAQAFQIWQGMLSMYGTHNYNQTQADGNR